jgi:lysophospholipase L1-like esterase
MNKIFTFIVNTAIILVITVLIAAVADVCFRQYEKKFYIKAVDKEVPVINLQQYGFNDHGLDLSRSNDSGEFRILCIGDSYTTATTKAEYSYSAVLEKELNGLGLRKHFRVINLGIPGTSFPQYMAYFGFWSKLIDFDAVVFNNYLGNDYTDVESTPYSPDRAVIDNLLTGVGTTLPHEHSLRFMDYIFAIKEAKKYSCPGTAQYKPSFQFPRKRYVQIMSQSARVFNPAELPKFHNALDWAHHFMNLVRQMQDSGIKVAVIASPPHIFFDNNLLLEVAEISHVKPDTFDPALPVFLLDQERKRAGVKDPIIDPSACLASHAGMGEKLYYGTDTHWTVEGNKAVGDYLAAVLATRWFGLSTGSDTLGCGTETALRIPSEKGQAAIRDALAKFSPAIAENQ